MIFNSKKYKIIKFLLTILIYIKTNNEITMKFNHFFILILILLPSNVVFGEIIFSQAIETFETKQNGIMQFNQVVGIALDKEGKIYAADFRNFGIQIFDSHGNFDSFISIAGKPHGVEVEGDKVYVAVWGEPKAHVGSHIELFFTNGTKITSFLGPVQPGDIAINDFGHIYVTDYNGAGTIEIFDSSGNLLETLTTPLTLDGKNSILTGITLDDLGNIYVTDYGNNRVMKLDSSGNLLFEFTLPYEEEKFKAPNNIEIGPNGNFFVTDILDRILIFDSSGNFLYSFGESGSGHGQFNQPHGIVIDDFNRIYTAEFNGNRVQIFDIVNSFKMEPNKIDSRNNPELSSYNIIETQMNSSKDIKSMCGNGTIEKDRTCIGDTTIGTEKVITEEESKGGGCLIATAAYGSEMSPQVQLLREIRDNQLMNTESGTAFMSGFNELYYSFSPTIADMERESPIFKEIVKAGLTPMISSLSLMENANSESEVLGLGLSVIALNLGMYLGVPAVVVIGIRKKF
jgi:DNA-binding beta-propeller fold protein YncE